MAKKTGSKVPYDLARALARWDNEGGATAANGAWLELQVEEERILKCLGAAVILSWNELPTEVQRRIFDNATSIADPARQFQLKQIIAQFLHDRKDDP